MSYFSGIYNNIILASNTKYINLLKRWLPGCLLFFLPACHQPPAARDYTAAIRQIDSARQLARSGDLIFRNGIDEVSEAARKMNRHDTTYSHCGLVLVEHDTVFVYHAIGGKYNPGQRLKREPIDSFCSPADNDRFGLFRYALNASEEARLEQIIHQHYRAGLKFDMYFNFFSDDVMYCSEFVFKSLNRSLGGKLNKYIQLEQWPYGVSLDDLFLNEHSMKVKQVVFISPSAMTGRP